MESFCKNTVEHFTVPEAHDRRRLDHLLMSLFEGVPQSRIYRLIRSGQVRVNGHRITPNHRVNIGDVLRLPPVYPEEPLVESSTGRRANAIPPLKNPSILHEDDHIIIMNKPAGLAVHAGSGVYHGLIEQFRVLRSDLKFLELAHRLDRETSGLLILAKKRQALLALHEMFREHQIKKCYLALCLGAWPDDLQEVRLPLLKQVTEHVEKKMLVDPQGQHAHTLFRVLRRLGQSYTLVEAELKTGRTHQIRVHAASSGYPIAGDAKYGRFTVNRELTRLGLKRMFLHAHALEFTHPFTQEFLSFESGLPRELSKAMNLMSQENGE